MSRTHLKYSATGSTSVVPVAVWSGPDIEPEWILCSFVYEKDTGLHPHGLYALIETTGGAGHLVRRALCKIKI